MLLIILLLSLLLFAAMDNDENDDLSIIIVSGVFNGLRPTNIATMIPPPTLTIASNVKITMHFLDDNSDDVVVIKDEQRILRWRCLSSSLSEDVNKKEGRLLSHLLLRPSSTIHPALLVDGVDNADDDDASALGYCCRRLFGAILYLRIDSIRFVYVVPYAIPYCADLYKWTIL